MRKGLSLLLAVLLCFAVAVPAMAADNSAVDARISELSQKYNIGIRYDTDSDGTACIGTGTLHTLEKSLESITSSVVWQVSEHIRQKTGSRLTYYFTYQHNIDIPLEEGTAAQGVFNADTGVIRIFMPSSSKGTYFSGDNPLTMVHEFGHALQELIFDKYGQAKLKSEWAALNGGNSYTGSFAGTGSYSSTTFISEYASKSFDEDFAETFAHAVVRNRAGLGFYHLLQKDGIKTSLGKKMDYLMGLLPKCLDNGATLAANLGKAYTTPIYVDYMGQRLTGVHMQYIGYSYPRYVLRGIMASSEINDEISTSTWVYEIGGWYVASTSGRYYLVFPGGVVRQQVAALPIAA